MKNINKIRKKINNNIHIPNKNKNVKYFTVTNQKNPFLIYYI